MSSFRHEGRSWYSSHRGRLWIASTVQKPSPDEIQQVDNFYRALYDQQDLPFPEHYPTGCLLGCVEVTNVLPQEEYRLEFPNGESESPYVFICQNPYELFTKFSVKGQHKICKFGIHFLFNSFNISIFMLVNRQTGCRSSSDGQEIVAVLKRKAKFLFSSVKECKIHFMRTNKWEPTVNGGKRALEMKFVPQWIQIRIARQPT